MDKDILDTIDKVLAEIKMEEGGGTPPICPVAAPIPYPPSDLDDDDIESNDNKQEWSTIEQINFYDQKLESLYKFIKAGHNNHTILSKRHMENILDLEGSDTLDAEVTRHCDELKQLFNFMIFQLKTTIRKIEDYQYDRE